MSPWLAHENGNVPSVLLLHRRLMKESGRRQWLLKHPCAAYVSCRNRERYLLARDGKTECADGRTNNGRHAAFRRWCRRRGNELQELVAVFADLRMELAPVKVVAVDAQTVGERLVHPCFGRVRKPVPREGGALRSRFQQKRIVRLERSRL